jgi:hypothetical protein
MAVIAYTDRTGSRSWVATFNDAQPIFGTHAGASLRWTDHISEAAEFADNAAVLAFLSGKDAGTIANGQIVTQTAGPVNYGKRQH